MTEHVGPPQVDAGLQVFDLNLVHIMFVKTQNDLWPFNPWISIDTQGGSLKNVFVCRVSGLEMGAFPIPVRQWQREALSQFFSEVCRCAFEQLCWADRYQTSLQFEIIAIRELLYLYYTVVTNNLKWCLTISSERATQTQRYSKLMTASEQLRQLISPHNLLAVSKYYY